MHGSLPFPLSLLLSACLVFCRWKRAHAGHLSSQQWWPSLWQFKHLYVVQSHVPATACLHGHLWLCLSDLYVPPHMWHLTEPLSSRHAFEFLGCLSPWHLEHWMSSSLLIHFSITTSWPKRADLPFMSVPTIDPSGSEMAKVMVE